MVRIGRASHCGFVRQETSLRGGGAGAPHSAPDARGSQAQGTVRLKVAVPGTPYLSSARRLRALHDARILEVTTRSGGTEKRAADDALARRRGVPPGRILRPGSRRPRSAAIRAGDD